MLGNWRVVWGLGVGLRVWEGKRDGGGRKYSGEVMLVCYLPLLAYSISPSTFSDSLHFRLFDSFTIALLLANSSSPPPRLRFSHALWNHLSSPKLHLPTNSRTFSLSLRPLYPPNLSFLWRRSLVAFHQIYLFISLALWYSCARPYLYSYFRCLASSSSTHVSHMVYSSLSSLSIIFPALATRIFFTSSKRRLKALLYFQPFLRFFATPPLSVSSPHHPHARATLIAKTHYLSFYFFSTSLSCVLLCWSCSRKMERRFCEKDDESASRSKSLCSPPSDTPIRHLDSTPRSRVCILIFPCKFILDFLNMNSLEFPLEWSQRQQLKLVTPLAFNVFLTANISPATSPFRIFFASFSFTLCFFFSLLRRISASGACRPHTVWSPRELRTSSRGRDARTSSDHAG
jgi:hypothetical protein